MSPTHRAACLEFIQGFTEFGFSTSEVTSLEDCAHKTILVLSDHKINIDYLTRMNTIAPDTIYILWFYHNVLDKVPFKYFILTGEHYYKTPRLQTHIPIDAINKQIPNFVPLLLRANESPDRVGTYPKTNRLNGCFMGSPYKKGFVSHLPNTLYHDIWHSGLLSYDERRAIYLDSIVAFGFHANENIQNYHVTQRVFEGLAYGCVVISDNEAARDITGGIVEFAESQADMLRLYNHYLSHPEECKKKAEAGYAWSKLYGTNRYAAKLFLDKAAALWNIQLT